MSTLLFTTNFKPMPGGIATYLDELCRHLPPSVQVVTTANGGGFEGEGDGYGVTRLTPARVRKLEILSIWATLTAEVFRHRPDVALVGHAHSTHWAYPLHLWSLTGARYGIIAYALEVRELGRAGGWQRRLQARMYRDADFVIAISEFTRGLLAESGVDVTKIHVVHPGVSARYLEPEDARQAVRASLGLGSEFVIGTTARLVRRKGHELVLQALAKLSGAGAACRYLVVGDGPERERLGRLATSLGIADLAIFLGHVDGDDLPGLYDAMDLFVLPTQPTGDPYDVEGFGIVFLEAAARGVPSVASPIGGVPDAVINGETGLLVPPVPDAIAEAIATLMNDTQLRSRMATRARNRVMDEFTWPRVAAEFARIAGLGE